MTGNGRGTMRPQGRTPPFLLIGLLVVLCILGVSYWNVSSKSNERVSVIARLQEELQSLSSRKLEADKRSSETNTKLDEVEKMKAALESRLLSLEKEIDESKNLIESRGQEVHSVQTELESRKEALKKCEEDLSGVEQELQKLKEEVEALRLEAANKPVQCDLNTCSDPVQTVFNVLINSLGRPQLETSLKNNPEYQKFISAGEAGNPKPPDAQVIVDPNNPQQPFLNPDSQGSNQGAKHPVQQDGQPVVYQQGQAQVDQQAPAPVDQQAQAPADQQAQAPAINPAVNPAEQAALGQVQPPQDLQKAGQENVTKVVDDDDESVLTTKVEGSEGNHTKQEQEAEKNEDKEQIDDGKEEESDGEKKEESDDGKKEEIKEETDGDKKEESNDGKKEVLQEESDGKKEEELVEEETLEDEENENKDKGGDEELNKANKDLGMKPDNYFNSNLNDEAHEKDPYGGSDRLFQNPYENKLGENIGNGVNHGNADIPAYQMDRQNDRLLQLQHDEPLQREDYDDNLMDDSVNYDKDTLDKNAVDYNTGEDNGKLDEEEKAAVPQLLNDNLDQPDHPFDKVDEGAPAGIEMFPAVPVDNPDHIEGDELEEDNGGEDQREEGQDLKFKPKMPPIEVEKDNDAIDRMNKNMAEAHQAEENAINRI